MFKKLIRAYKEYKLKKTYNKLFEISLNKTSDIYIPAQEMKKNATLESLKQRKCRIAKDHRLADGTFDNLDGMLQYGISNLLYFLRIKDFSNARNIALGISATYFRIALYANRMSSDIDNKKEEAKNETADKSGSDRSETEKAEEHNL